MENNKFCNDIVLRSSSLADVKILYHYYAEKALNLTGDAAMEAARRRDICKEMYDTKLGEYERHIFIIPIDEFEKSKKK